MSGKDTNGTGPGRTSEIAAATRREAALRDRMTKIGLLAVSVLTCLLLLAAALRENFLAPWKQTQREYARILRLKATDDRGRKLARDFRVEMRQTVLPELNGIDRCISCHTGIDDPRMTDVADPFAVHPGRYLEWHEVNRFGCTICHRGQGRAMSFADAKAEDRHWDWPLLPVELSQSACGLCHSPREVAERGGEVFAAGAALFEAKGCRSCHRLGGRGGSLGPVLDNEGGKVPGNLPMAAIQGPHTVPQWLTEHFADPQKVVVGSRMPCPGLDRTQTNALITFLLSRQLRDLPASYLTPARHLDLYTEANPEVMTAEQLYNRFCSTCHDTGFRGRYDKFFQAFIPAIRGESYRSQAEPAYVAANLRQGRQGSIMPSWGLAAGGLREEEVRLLTTFLLGREVTAEEIAPSPGAGVPPLADRTINGDVAHGALLFSVNCSGCHGPAGAGQPAPSLNSPVFQAYAGDRYLYRTISEGRRNTAMPAFGRPGGLGDREIRDLVSFVHTLGAKAGPANLAAR